MEKYVLFVVKESYIFMTRNLYLYYTPGKNQLRLRKEPVAAENRIAP